MRQLSFATAKIFPTVLYMGNDFAVLYVAFKYINEGITVITAVANICQRVVMVAQHRIVECAVIAPLKSA